MNALLKDIAELGVHEKLQLVEDLWDSTRLVSPAKATPLSLYAAL